MHSSTRMQCQWSFLVTCLVCGNVLIASTARLLYIIMLHPPCTSLCSSLHSSRLDRRRISAEKKSFGFGALNKLSKLMSCVRIALALPLSLSLFISLSLSFSCCCVPHSAKSPPGNALHKIIGDFHIDLCIRLVVH